MRHGRVPLILLAACVLACALVAVLAPSGCSTTPHFVDDTSTSSGAGAGTSTGTRAGSGGLGTTTTTSTGLGGAPATTTTSDTTTSSATTTTTTTTTTTGCVPATCGSLGAACGNPMDGCGNVLSCGTCPASHTCSAGYQCVCNPTTCVAQNANCGQISDGCGGMLDCGTCAGDFACGVDGTPNVCALALSTGCGMCPPGFPSLIGQIHNEDCGMFTNGCGTETVVELVCYRGAIQVEAGCNIMCPPGYHFAGDYADCVCVPSGVLGVCITD